MAATKQDISQLETAPGSDNADLQDEKHDQEEALDDDPVYSYAEQRKIVHRLDRRLITIAGVIYMNSLMDRSNLPNAAIAGMNRDLEMETGFRYVRLTAAWPESR
jgi:hypothetical protein